MKEEFSIVLVVYLLIFIANRLLKNKQGYMPAVILGAAFLAPLLAGMGLRPREVVEGSFAYLDNLMAVLMGSLFAAILYDNGTFEKILDRWLSKKRGAFWRMLGVLLFIALPGMFAGSALVSLLTTGRIAHQKLKERGMMESKAREVVAVGSLLGMLMPPICVPAIIMVIGRAGSYNPTFEGFFVPLLALSLPALLVYAAVARKDLPLGEGEAPSKGMVHLLPLLLVCLLILLHNFAYRWMPFLGYPLIYALGFLLACVFKVRSECPYQSALKGLEMTLLPAALMLVVGSLNESLTLCGVTGGLNTMLIQAAPWLLFLVPCALLLVAGAFAGAGSAFALAALLPNLVNGSGLWGSPLRLLAVGAVLCCVPFLFPERTEAFLTPALGEPLTKERVSARLWLPMALVIACALGMGLVGGLDVLMI